MIKRKFLNTALALSMFIFSCNLPQGTTVLEKSKAVIVDQSKIGNVKVVIDQITTKFDNFKVQGIDFANTSIKKLKLEVVGFGITTPVAETINWTPGQAATFNLSVLAGTNRIITVYALDANDNVMGSLMGALDVAVGQNNPGKISFFETAVAQVLYNILNSNKANLLNTLKIADLRKFVKDVTIFDETNNKFSGVNPVKFNTKLVSDFIQANNGSLPATNTPNLEATGTLSLKLNTLGAKVMINDPNSLVVTSNTGYDTTITGITPGRWILTILKTGYAPSRTIIDVSSTGLIQTISLNTGSSSKAGGSTAGKDESGDLGPAGLPPNGTGNKTLFAIYLLGSDLEDDVRSPKGTADEVSTGAITISGTKITNGSGTVSTSGAGSNDLREINNALKNMTPAERANVDVIVGFGGARKQGWKGIKYADGNCIIKDSADNYFGNSDCYGKKDEAVSMGNGGTLADFVTYIKDTYPSANYGKRIIDLWDHGGAHLGFGPDTITREKMTLKEINDALAKDPIKYDIVGFDACLMGNLEVAKFVQRRANYLLASEELEPGHGWQYTEILNYIAKNPTSSSVDIGKYMVDSFVTSQSHISTDGKTLSLVNLSKLDNVNSKLDSFVTTLTPILSSNLGKIAQAANKSEIYAKDTKKGTGFNFDFKSFLTELKKLNSSIDSTQLDIALSDYVVYSKSDTTRPRSTGVAIFDVNNTQHINGNSYNVNRAATTNWFNFAKSFVTLGTQGDGGKPSVQAVTNSGNIQIQAVNTDICADGSCFKITDDRGIKTVEAIKLIRDSETRFRLVGSDPAQQVGPDTYKAPTWNGNVLMIDGDIVPAEFYDINKDGNKLYIADGLLNGEDVIFTFEIYGGSQVLNSWATPFDETDDGEIVLAKEQLELKTGDTIQFYYNVIDIEADIDDEWDLGPEVGLEASSFTFGKPQGELYTFLLGTDLFGNTQNTDLVPAN